MPILACLTSFLLACACLGSMNLLVHNSTAAHLNHSAAQRPTPATTGTLTRTPERLARPFTASFSIRMPEVCK